MRQTPRQAVAVAPPAAAWEAVLGAGAGGEGFTDVELLCLAHVCRALRGEVLRECAARRQRRQKGKAPNMTPTPDGGAPPKFFAELGRGRAGFCFACGSYGECRLRAGLGNETLCLGCAGDRGVRFEEAKGGRHPFAFTFKSQALCSQTLSKGVESLAAVEVKYARNAYRRGHTTLLYVGLAEMLNEQWEECGRLARMDGAEYVAARRALLQKAWQFKELLESLKGAHVAEMAAIKAAAPKKKAAVKKKAAPKKKAEKKEKEDWAEEAAEKNKNKKKEKEKEKEGRAQARREKKQAHVQKVVDFIGLCSSGGEGGASAGEGAAGAASATAAPETQAESTEAGAGAGDGAEAGGPSAAPPAPRCDECGKPATVRVRERACSLRCPYRDCGRDNPWSGEVYYRCTGPGAHSYYDVEIGGNPEHARMLVSNDECNHCGRWMGGTVRMDVEWLYGPPERPSKKRRGASKPKPPPAAMVARLGRFRTAAAPGDTLALEPMSNEARLSVHHHCQTHHRGALKTKSEGQGDARHVVVTRR